MLISLPGGAGAEVVCAALVEHITRSERQARMAFIETSLPKIPKDNLSRNLYLIRVTHFSTHGRDLARISLIG